MAAVAAAGFPPGVINFLPGRGDNVGEYLVGHPRTRFINFTGSKEMGLRINSGLPRSNPANTGSKEFTPKWAARAPSL